MQKALAQGLELSEKLNKALLTIILVDYAISRNCTMNRQTKNRAQSDYIQRQIFIIAAVLLVVFIVAQFIVLDLAGIHGPQITRLRQEQNELKVSNELKRAKINELNTSNDIKSYASQDLGLVSTPVTTLKVKEDNVTASINGN